MNGYLQPYFAQRYALGYDPATGVDVVNGPAMWAGRQIIRTARHVNRRRAQRMRGDDEIGWDEAIAGDEDELGAEDYEELGAIDDEISAIDDDDDDDDELGANPERRRKRKIKKLQRKERKAERVLARIEKKLDRLPQWRRRKREKLKDKRTNVKDKLRSIRADIRALRGGGGGGAGGGGVRAATPAETKAVLNQEYAVNNLAGGPGAAGVYAAAAAPQQNIELPITFSTGGKLWEATVAATTAAGAEVNFDGETTPYTYLDLQVIGVKVTAFLNAPLMSDGGSTPLDVGIIEQSAQAAVIVDNATVDGGLNMYPDDQVVNLGGMFGRSSEEIFSGMRLQDIIYANGKCQVSGKLQLAFQAAQEYDVSLRLSVLARILKDRRVRPAA